MRIRIQEGKQLPRTIEIKIVRQLFSHLYHKKAGTTGVRSYNNKAIIRDIAVMELLFETGLRVFELCNLRKDEIDFVGKFLKVQGKGNKERIVPICSSQTYTALKDYYQIFRDNISLGDFFLSTV